jgi:hypothetical protein
VDNATAVKACTRCEIVKPFTDFYPSNRERRYSICKECVLTDRRVRYAADPAYRARSHAAAREWQRKNSQLLATRRQAVRLEMIAAYGSMCECCGETAAEFLTMDHVGGWGKEHRERDKSAASRLPFILKKEGWPKDGFRLLCWNCNCARGIYGYCPHGQLV